MNYATADGTAAAGSDYTAKSGTLTFTQAAAGAQTFTVQTTENILAERAETFTVTIASPSGGGGRAPTLGTSSVTTTIADDDATSDPPNDGRPGSIGATDIWLSVAPDSVDEGAGVTTFTVTATYYSGMMRSEDVEIELTLAGTADDSDYTAPAQASVTILGRQSSGTGTLTLTLTDDNLTEGDETIIVGGRSGELRITSTVIVINDDEATYLSIAGPAADVQEGANASFTVTLSRNVAEEVTVAWSDAPRTAQTSDYTDSSGTVTFPANSGAGATQTFTIATTQDTLSESAETFDAVLGAVSGDGADGVYVKTTAAGATATIAESDPITVSISGPSTVDEGDATANYTVSLSPSGVTPT